METIAGIIKTCLKENPCGVEVFYNEPMAKHCTFKTGGPADCFGYGRLGRGGRKAGRRAAVQIRNRP